MKNNSSTEKALTFLSKRNPLNIDQIEYIHILFEFHDIHGDDAIEALAGFYVWCIDNLPAEKQDRAINETFSHDLFRRSEKFMAPRSGMYKKYWDEEFEKHYTNAR